MLLIYIYLYIYIYKCIYKYIYIYIYIVDFRKKCIKKESAQMAAENEQAYHQPVVVSSGAFTAGCCRFHPRPYNHRTVPGVLHHHLPIFCTIPSGCSSGHLPVSAITWNQEPACLPFTPFFTLSLSLRIS